MTMAKAELLCLVCGGRFPLSDTYRVCPRCGDDGIPAASEDEVTIQITWHELRCLVMWAEQYAAAVNKKDIKTGQQTLLLTVVYSNAGRIHDQHLHKKPLTLAREIAELKGTFWGEKRYDSWRPRATR